MVVLLGVRQVCGEEFAATTAAERVVAPEMDVGIEYTLTVDGVVVDSTDGQGPWHYVHGHGQLLPEALERQLEGLRVGESRDVMLGPAEGYGEVDPQLFVDVPASDLPADMTPSIGMVLRGINPDGQSFQARIAEIKPDSVVLNLNHPLAGKTLHFKVTVTDISPLPVGSDPSGV
jgi:FKBP-type peptidyl-prolyl cis-trans isomerase SlyD